MFSLMYMDQLAVMTLPIGSIYLDPNNPRFWTTGSVSAVPEKKIADPGVQARARKDISAHGIDELYNSILRNGFLLLDRIVVRPIRNTEDKYVVVEGNRRFTALTRLRANIEDGLVDEADLADDAQTRIVSDTDRIEVLVYSGDGATDISWMLQGIRHIGGIRNWEPAQRAKLVAEQIDKHGKTLREAGEQFGLSAIAAGRLYRSYKAILQMQEDEEFAGKARNEYFSLFEEAIRNPSVKAWLDWREDDSKFHDEENLGRFYAWISPDDENGGRRRLHDPRHVKKLGFLIAGKHQTLLDDLDAFDVTIDDAEAQARTGSARGKDWKEEIARARKIISALPLSSMFEEPEAFAAELDVFIGVVEEQRDQARRLADGR